MLYGITGAGVDGVGVLAAVADVEFAVIAGGDHAVVAAVGGPDLTDVLARAVVAVDWIVDADAPAFARRVESSAADLAYVYKHVGDAKPPQHLEDEIAAEALRDGIEVENRERTAGLQKCGSGDGHTCAAQAVNNRGSDEARHPAGGKGPTDLLIGGHFARSKSESPDVEERAAGRIEGAAASLPHLVGQAVEAGEHRSKNDGVAAVEPREK